MGAKVFNLGRILSGVALLTGCSSPYLYVKNGPKAGETVTGVARNALSDVRNFEGWGAKVYLSPQRILGKNGEERFQIVVQLTRGGGSFIVINPGPSLKLNVDGKSMTYTTRQGSGPRRVITHGSLGETTLSESAIYEKIPKSDIKFISEAKNVKVEIIGRDGTITARFSETNLAAFQTLIENSDNPAP